jgi:hypothetical protein
MLKNYHLNSILELATIGAIKGKNHERIPSKSRDP